MKNNNKQLFFLFWGSFTIVVAGNGLFPVLPLYAAQFGATRTQAGFYLTLMYIAITLGSFVPSWLAGKVPLRWLFVAAGTLGIPCLALMGQVRTLWHLMGITAVLWFCGGVGLALIAVFTGMVAEKNQRGKSFGLLSLTSPLGALVGGAMVSWLLTWRDYATLFWVYAAIWLALPLIGLLALPRQPASTTTARAQQLKPQAVPLGQAFYLLTLISLLAATALNIGRFGTTVSMQLLAFSPGAVASTATVSGLVAIPVTFYIGALSDRLGRKRILALGYSLSAVGVLLLITAVHLWHFWLAAALILVSRSVSEAVSAALATDLLEPSALGKGLPLLNGLTRAGGIISFVGAGIAMDYLGVTTLYWLTAVLALAAALQLLLLQRNRSFLLHPARAFLGRKPALGRDPC
ncbi:MAG: MFS transporter [Anaerolineaceae bacterium]|nr:MFS transporter [Anaerolineaceae bacterium]